MTSSNAGHLVFWQALARLHPLGLTDDWADKLAGESFTSPNQRVTHEHYSQVGPLLRQCPWAAVAPPWRPWRSSCRSSVGANSCSMVSWQ
jgi:hypothetical protein